MSLKLETVVELKKLIDQKFGAHLHFHDTCGAGTYFSLDQSNPEIAKFLVEYCQAHKLHLDISADKKTFSIFENLSPIHTGNRNSQK